MPDLQGRLVCMGVKLEFPNQFVEFNQSLKNIKASIEAIKDNEELKAVFALVLKIGNYLNQGSRSSSGAFKIDILTRLSLVRGCANHSNFSMLEFLLKTILNK